jgi:hypothetical protein
MRIRPCTRYLLREDRAGQWEGRATLGWTLLPQRRAPASVRSERLPSLTHRTGPTAEQRSLTSGAHAHTHAHAPTRALALTLPPALSKAR